MFIDVSSGLSISTKHIEAIESVDELSSLVHTTTKTFEVAMPKNVLLSFIGNKDEGSNSMNRVEKLLVQIYSTQSSQRI